MKKIKIITSILIIAGIAGNAHAQNLNWESLKPETKHLLNITVGLDYGTVTGIGYGYHLKFFLPTVLNISYSAPAGSKFFDDFKTKIGGQIRLVKIHDFAFTANVYGVFRRYENPFARWLNFGSDFSGVAGYYRTHWFVAGEFGFDKAVVTNFKHSTIYRENYPQVQDGWYQPATGGNFYYGLQTGFSFEKSDITLTFGKIIEQDFRTDPLIPFYARLGFIWKFGEHSSN